MKICELKINYPRDRSHVAGILANAGYKVSVEERNLNDGWNGKDYFVIVETKDRRSDSE